MPYLSDSQVQSLHFKHVGRNVKISDKACIYNPENIAIGDHSRIDDFCVISGNVTLGAFCHITPMCLIAGGVPGVYFSDFCTLAYGVKVFSQSDDYSGASMVNSLIPKKYKAEVFKAVSVGRQSVIGAGSVVLPGVNIAEGCAIGAMSLLLRSTDPWGIYAGVPANRLKDRKQDLLQLEKKFLAEYANDPI